MAALHPAGALALRRGARQLSRGEHHGRRCLLRCVSLRPFVGMPAALAHDTLNMQHIQTTAVARRCQPLAPRPRRCVPKPLGKVSRNMITLSRGCSPWGDGRLDALVLLCPLCPAPSWRAGGGAACGCAACGCAFGFHPVRSLPLGLPCWSAGWLSDCPTGPSTY